MTVPTPANFSVTIDETNAPVAEGGDLLVNATAENVGGANGTQDVVQRVNSTVAVTERLTVDGGSRAPVNFTYTTPDGDASYVTVRVRRSYLLTTGVAPQDVALHRAEPDGWRGGDICRLGVGRWHRRGRRRRPLVPNRHRRHAAWWGGPPGRRSRRLGLSNGILGRLDD